jgi:hypothetical protein
VTLQIPHPHDVKWYREQLAMLPAAYRQRAMDGYSAVWLETYEANAGEIAQSNRARYAANSRLRKFVKKITKSAC